jgi:anti-anti-sigma regulatory factor
MEAHDVQIVRDGGEVRLTVMADMTVANALDLKELLLEPLKDARAAVLDLRQAGEVDTAGVQIVIMLARYMEGRGFRILPGEAVRGAFQVFRMGDFLDQHGGRDDGGDNDG